MIDNKSSDNNREVEEAGDPTTGMGETTLREFFTSDGLLLAAVLLVGVAGSGVARWSLGQLGLTTLGEVVYIAGYGGMVVVVWYGWIRPLDITGPVERN